MRIAELSRISGVPIPTVKYYMREGLLPGGTISAPNQADYSGEHVRRLHLIRTLAEVGNLPLKQIRLVLDALGNEKLPMHLLLGVAHHALGPAPEPSDDEPAAVAAREDVDRFIADLGWKVAKQAPARRSLARALVTLRRMSADQDVDVFAPYARAADRIAAREVPTISKGDSKTEAVENVVVGTVVFEAALSALRRLAQEHHSAIRPAR